MSTSIPRTGSIGGGAPLLSVKVGGGGGGPKPPCPPAPPMTNMVSRAIPIFPYAQFRARAKGGGEGKIRHGTFRWH